jgi:hypothetical protein
VTSIHIDIDHEEPRGFALCGTGFVGCDCDQRGANTSRPAVL